MNVYLQSLGCRLNQSEIGDLARQFASAGFAVVPSPGEADICVINTCAVTAEAERKSRRRVRSLARANSTANTAVIGCYASLSPQRCGNMLGVAWVVPNSEKERTVDIVTSSPLFRPSCRSARVECGTPGYLRTRAFVKVQDGCDNHCTYCITRLLRGPGHSRSLTDVVGQVGTLVASGVQEIVLTGANAGSYGRNLGLPRGLHALIEALLIRTDVPRLRLSSVEPWELDEAFFGLWSDSRLCRQLHLPLQAGCDETLRWMGRRTSTAEFAQLVRTARAAIPDLAVTTDVIVGFPGESEAMFRASLDFVAAMNFAKLHVFPYSPRPGTAANLLPGRVPPDLRQARAHAMRAMGTELTSRFRQQFVGREMTVLWEQRTRNGFWSGLTDNYLRVIARSERNLHNRLTGARLLAVQDGCLVGETLE